MELMHAKAAAARSEEFRKTAGDRLSPELKKQIASLIEAATERGLREARITVLDSCEAEACRDYLAGYGYASKCHIPKMSANPEIQIEW